LVISVVIGLAIIGAAMVPLETWWPGVSPQRRFRRGWLLDVVYWFFTALVTKPIATFAVVLALFPVVILSGVSFQSLVQGHGPIGRQAPLLQALEIVILMDFVGYWSHRAFHAGRLWSFHAIHHSSVELDWLSAARLHPVNDIVVRLLQAMVIVVLGFSPAVLAGALPVFTAYAIFLHANVSWDFGPLRTVLGSPRFHRWHHTSAAEGRDKNFAGLLPLWDILFGTYYMPAQQPTQFGVAEPVPENLIGQLVWPFQEKFKRLA
jgi:sterol desaturase/sphingolipid hydroxylase (fatty acid hydroxylase superfamily)